MATIGALPPNGNGVQRPHPGERPGVVRCNDGLGVTVNRPKSIPRPWPKVPRPIDHVLRRRHCLHTTMIAEEAVLQAPQLRAKTQTADARTLNEGPLRGSDQARHHSPSQRQAAERLPAAEHGRRRLLGWDARRTGAPGGSLLEAHRCRPARADMTKPPAGSSDPENSSSHHPARRAALPLEAEQGDNAEKH